MINQLKPTEIIRDEMGCWVHPEFLKYLDDNHADQEWLSQADWDQLKEHFNIVTTRLYLEGSVSDDQFWKLWTHRIYLNGIRLHHMVFLNRYRFY